MPEFLETFKLLERRYAQLNTSGPLRRRQSAAALDETFERAVRVLKRYTPSIDAMIVSAGAELDKLRVPPAAGDERDYQEELREARSLGFRSRDFVAILQLVREGRLKPEELPHSVPEVIECLRAIHERAKVLMEETTGSRAGSRSARDRRRKELARSLNHAVAGARVLISNSTSKRKYAIWSYPGGAGAVFLVRRQLHKE